MSKNSETLIGANTLSSYLRYLKAKPDTPATIAGVRKHLEAFLLWCQDEGIDAPLGVRRGDVVGWLGHMHEHYAASTVRLHFGQVRSWYNWLVDEEELGRSPFARVPAPEVEQRPRDVQPPDVMAQAVAMLEREKEWRALAIIAFVYDCGTRAKETAGVRLEDVDLDSGEVLIRRETTKTAAGQRVVRMSPATVRYVDRYLRRRPDRPWNRTYLFTGERGPLTPGAIYWVVRRVFRRLGAEGIVGPHDLRHTAATHMLPHMTESQMMTYFGWTSSERVRLYARQALRGESLRAHELASPMMRLPKKS